MARRHYDILQIQPDASADEIQRAYRKLARHYHPDHNSSSTAALQMAAINEAYRSLRDPSHAVIVDSKAVQQDWRADLTSSILAAARTVILRHGWTVCDDRIHTMLFETGNPCVRIVLTDRLTADSLLRIVRRDREVEMVLAVHIDEPLAAAEGISVIDLMHADRLGAPIPEGPCKALLAGFL